jgi:RNA polymerase-binding transcription factor DksA
MAKSTLHPFICVYCHKEINTGRRKVTKAYHIRVECGTKKNKDKKVLTPKQVVVACLD